MESIKDKLKTMFEMQEALNVYTNGADYKETKVCAKTGKPINYRRCAWMETAEFVDSFDWKHWKHGKDDIENAKTELVDIWHFLLSDALIKQKEADLESIALLVEYGYRLKSAEDNVFRIADHFVHALTAIQADSDRLNDGKHNNSVYFESWTLFCMMCDIIGLSFDELYQRYIIKNTLNKFRQDNGYAEGSYIKIWHGDKEDNVFAVLFAEHLNQTLTAGSLYGALEYFYIKSVIEKKNLMDDAEFKSIFGGQGHFIDGMLKFVYSELENGNRKPK